MKIVQALYFKFLVAMLLAAVITGGAVYLYGSLTGGFGRPDVVFRTDQASVVREIRELERLETAVFTIEKIIEAGTEGNVFQEILYGDRILLIAHGQTVAGFDLKWVGEDDIQVNGDQLIVNLPEPEIFFVRLDSERTRVYDRRLGLLSRGDKDLETQARIVAENSIRAAACEAGILDEASRSAKRQLKALFSALGFSDVTVIIPETDCI